MHGFPRMLTLADLASRLSIIFPEGMAQRNYFIRPLAVQTVFVMLYAGAVVGTGRWFRPNLVSRMTDEQAERVSDSDREEWTRIALSPRRKASAVTRGWIADNSREPMRDETLRGALLTVGAVVQRSGIDTSSSKPRWALAPEFVELLLCPIHELAARAQSWRERHLAPPALARVALAERGITWATAGDSILVTFPNGETRRLPVGKSSNITKAVIEDFSARYLASPGVVWVSDSKNKVTLRDDELARRVGLDIDAKTVLPDIILVDLGTDEPLFVFVESVASDGPINEQRRATLLEMLVNAGHKEHNAAFVTAFWDRGDAAFRKVAGDIAGNSFVWAATEPEKIIVVRDSSEHRVLLSELLG